MISSSLHYLINILTNKYRNTNKLQLLNKKPLIPLMADQIMMKIFIFTNINIYEFTGRFWAFRSILMFHSSHYMNSWSTFLIKKIYYQYQHIYILWCPIFHFFSWSTCRSILMFHSSHYKQHTQKKLFQKIKRQHLMHRTI